MASISKERLREMEEEMDRFEAEIQVPGGPPIKPFILGANTYDKVQAQLSSLRQAASMLQQRGRRDDVDDEDDDDDDDEEDHDVHHRRGRADDVDLRQLEAKFMPSRKRTYQDHDPNEFHDIDERPGRPQGPIIPPPPPPPPPPIAGPPATVNDMSLFAPPPPPPPEPEEGGGESGQSTLSFKPYAPGEGPHIPRPAFMPPQLRHRMPPPGLRPPFLRPPMRMGMPPGPYGGPLGFPRHPHMMGMGPQMGQMNPGMHQGLPMSNPGVPIPQGPQMIQPTPPGIEPGVLQFVTPMIDGAPTEVKPSVVVEQPKVVYSAAPVITVEIKKVEKKKKKKKKKGQVEPASGENKEKTAHTGKDSTGTDTAAHPSITTSTEEDKSVMDMEIVPDSALVGGIMTAAMTPEATLAAAASTNTQGAPGTGAPGKKEKKKKEKKFLRLAANTTWEDPTLSEWAQDDFRMFCGDLGNEVTDETLVRAFNKYPSFLKAKVIRDRRTNKTRGYGFVSFKDPVDFTRAMREMNGKYVGNRPIKLRKSSWRDRNLEVVRKKDKEKKKLGLR